MEALPNLLAQRINRSGRSAGHLQYAEHELTRRGLRDDLDDGGRGRRRRLHQGDDIEAIYIHQCFSAVSHAVKGQSQGFTYRVAVKVGKGPPPKDLSAMAIEATRASLLVSCLLGQECG